MGHVPQLLNCEVIILALIISLNAVSVMTRMWEKHLTEEKD